MNFLSVHYFCVTTITVITFISLMWVIMNEIISNNMYHDENIVVWARLYWFNSTRWSILYIKIKEILVESLVSREQQNKYYFIKHQIYILKKPDGSFMFSDSEKAEIFKLHLSDTFHPYSHISDDSNFNMNEVFLNSSFPLSPN